MDEMDRSVGIMTKLLSWLRMWKLMACLEVHKYQSFTTAKGDFAKFEINKVKRVDDFFAANIELTTTIFS